MSSVLDMIIRITRQGNGLEQTKTGFSQLKSGLNDVVSGLTGFNLNTLTAAGLAVGLANSVKKSVEAYIEYADQVREGANLTGMSAEETSRLIQVSDDFGISYEKLRGIMQAANRNGFEPSIENLADLSDEYLALESPLERNQLLIDKLGRQGMDYAEIMKLGGDAIRERSAAVEEGMILDEEALAASRDFQMTVDDLEDTFMAMKYALAEEVIPALADTIGFFTEGIKVGQDLASWNKNLTTTWEAHAAEVENTATTYGDYVREAIRSADAAGMLDERQQRMAEAIENGRLSAENESQRMAELAEALGLTDQATWNASQTTTDWMGVLDGTAQALDMAATSTGNYNDGLIENDSLTQILKQSTSDLTMVELYNAAAKDLDAQSALQLGLQMGVLNGTTVAYLTKVEMLKDDLEAGRITTEQYKEAILALGGSLEDMANNPYDIMVNFSVDDSALRAVYAEITQVTGGNLSYGGGGQAGGGEARAEGGPVYAGERYWVGERGAEPFVPAQNGYVLSREDAMEAMRGAGGVTVNVQGMTVRNDMDIELIARRLAELAQRRH